MKTIAYEATVKNGQIELPETARLPDHTRVYVVVPGVETAPVFHIGSPRLAHPHEASDFVKEVMEDPPDAGLR